MVKVLGRPGSGEVLWTGPLERLGAQAVSAIKITASSVETTPRIVSIPLLQLPAIIVLMNYYGNLIQDTEAIQSLLADVHRVAVLGIKTQQQADQPAFYVPSYLAGAGLDIVPVAAYYPEVTSILGRRVYRKLADVPGDIDLVDVFRRSQDIPPHVEDILAKRPRIVWFQSGIRNDASARQLAEAGLKVVQDRCLMVEYRQFKVA